MLEKSGVKIIAIDRVPGHEGSGSPSIYKPDLKKVLVGMIGSIEAKEERVESHQIHGEIVLENRDVSGSLKHEIGSDNEKAFL